MIQLVAVFPPCLGRLVEFFEGFGLGISVKTALFDDFRIIDLALVKVNVTRYAADSALITVLPHTAQPVIVAFCAIFRYPK